MGNFQYFESLARYANNLLNRLPLEKEPQPLDYAVNKIYNAINSIAAIEIGTVASLWNRNISYPVNTKQDHAGLNSIGMLSDRFTILLIKEWCLRNKNSNPDKAKEIYETQTIDIMKAMASCQPGNASVNSKITSIKTEVTASCWEEAFYKLLSINLVLWESQEVLYVKDISLLPPEELRAYIKWFALGNMQRNVLIELNEKMFWGKIALTTNSFR